MGLYTRSMALEDQEEQSLELERIGGIEALCDRRLGKNTKVGVIYSPNIDAFDTTMASETTNNSYMEGLDRPWFAQLSKTSGSRPELIHQ